MHVAERLLNELRPAVLLITLGELGMFLCRHGQGPFHIPTVAQEVFDVSGAGDTVIATFTLAIAAGASPLEAAIISNHAAGIVVGKAGTATVGAGGVAGELQAVAQFPLVGCGFCRDGWAMTGTKVTVETIRAMKARGEKIAALTAYDFPMTRLLDEAGVPLILVGDSLGMVVLGYPDTTHVTMAEMEHHVRAAARAKPRALLAADMPYQSYNNVAEAVANAQRLAAAGAEAVKAEGGREIVGQVRAIVASRDSVPGPLGDVAPACARRGRLSRQRQERAGASGAAGGRTGTRSSGRFRGRAGTGHSAGCEGSHASGSDPDDRHWRRTGLRRPDPGHTRFAGHAAVVRSQARETQAQRGRADAEGRQGMEAWRGRIEGIGAPKVK